MARYIEDFVAGERHVSPTFEFTEKEIVEFARKYDPQPYHVDAQAARDSHFGGLIAAGCQTVSLAWALAYRTGLFDGALIAGIGLDEVRWVKPVHVGDVVRAEFFLLESRPSKSRPGAAVAKFQYEMKNQRDEIVLTLRMIEVLRSRE